MSQSTATTKWYYATTTQPDKMVTLVCKTCRMALYMSERDLQMPTWRCPSCGVITKSDARA